MPEDQTTQIYGPIATDLALVEELLESVKSVDISALQKMLEHALESRGKRLRPALVLLAGTFGNYDLNKLVPLGTAIELLHTASLVHDDVIDSAENRRGKPTANSLFDNALTVLLGDFLFANAAEMVTRTGSLKVTRLFSLTLMKMTSGELDQDTAAFDVGRDVQSYLSRIGGKTASLMENATEGGAVLAGFSNEGVEALRSYGYNLGMAFQIVDDILDFEGTEEVMGKPVGSDLREGTITLPTLLYLQSANPENVVKKFLETEQERQSYLQEAVFEITNSPALLESQKIAEDYVERAREALKILPENDSKTKLEKLGDYVLQRNN